MEEYKKKITKMLQTVTFVVYAIAMVLFAIFFFGILDGAGRDYTLAFAFIFLFLGVMSFVVYSPKIVGFLGEMIIKLLNKKKTKNKHDELLYCMLFSLAPLILFGVVIGLLFLLYLIF